MKRELKQMPHSLEAEQSVLGGMMLRPDSIDAISGKIVEADFFRKDHRAIFRALSELHARGKPCDAVTLGDWFTMAGMADVVSMDYLISISNDTPSAANIEAYAQIVRERSVRRSLIDMATSLSDESFAGHQEANFLLDKFITEMMAMSKIESGSEFTLRQAMSKAYENAARARDLGGRIPGITTGINKLDRITGGLHNSDLIVIGARPAMGKTAWLVNMANACGVSCGMISAEQPADQIAARWMSVDSHVPAERMRNGKVNVDDLSSLERSVGRLTERKCSIYERSSPNISEVSRVARKWKHQNDMRVLFVDYVQRIDAGDRRTPKHERVGDVVRGLKNLARDLQIPVVALAQVGRQVESREDKRPNMGDLSDSSEIEKEADQVMMLYRDEVYNEETPDRGIAEIDVVKNRHGPIGMVKTAWIAESMRFENLDTKF